MKRYGDVVAVDGIDLAAEPGTCLGLLGPNGAGKTTSIEMLEGILAPDGGDVRILGLSWAKNGREILERIGVQLQDTRLPEKLQVREVLRLFRSFYRRGREPEEVLEIIGLGEKADARYANLSGGQKQRLALGCALVNFPDVLFLDEPTTGLDPQARRFLWGIVEEFKDKGGTVLLTTHYMEEAERLADQLVILDHGRIIAQGTPEAIIDSLGAESIIEFTLSREADGPAAAGGESGAGAPALSTDAFTGLAGVVSARSEPGLVSLSVQRANRTLPALLERLRRDDVPYTDLHIHRPTLEDVFVSLTGKRLRDE